MKKTFLALLFLLFPLLAAPQRSEIGNRWVVGGSLGLGFSSSQTAININPQIGYRFNNWFTLGGGPVYAYYKYKDVDIKSNYAGLNAYGRVTPLPYIQLFAQPEIYRRWGKTRGVRDKEDVFPTLLLGGGAMIPVVQGGIVVSLYYDVLQDEHSPYKDELMYSVGYSFYF